jgi:hypothetical protein
VGEKDPFPGKKPRPTAPLLGSPSPTSRSPLARAESALMEAASVQDPSPGKKPIRAAPSASSHAPSSTTVIGNAGSTIVETASAQDVIKPFAEACRMRSYIQDLIATTPLGTFLPDFQPMFGWNLSSGEPWLAVRLEGKSVYSLTGQGNERLTSLSLCCPACCLEYNTCGSRNHPNMRSFGPSFVNIHSWAEKGHGPRWENSEDSCNRCGFLLFETCF